MLIPSERLIGVPVLSIHMGAPIARTVMPVINPDNLQIVAFLVDGPETGRGEIGDILDVKSIREFSPIGMVINSADDFILREEAVRLAKVLEINFQLMGKKVVTKRGSKLGKVIDYLVEPESMRITHIIVRRPALKAILDPELMIGFSQIAKVTDTEVVVKNEEEKVKKETAKQDFTPSFVNPFREPHYAPVRNQSPDELDN